MVARRSEIIANVHRLHEHMDRDGCAALVVRSGKNVTYLAGFAYPGTLARHLEFPDSPREVLLVWPRRDEPVLIVNHYAAPLARRDSWLRRLEIYDDYAESPYTRMAEVLTQIGLDRETVGFEKTYLSAARWEEIRGLLPQVRMVDCTEMMAQVRWIKTPGEIARLKEAADLLDEAYLEVFPTVVVGETERDVHSRLVASCIRRGAQWAHGILNSSRNTVAYGGEGETVF
jgi:Xaa-Pro aminopeptidase